MANENPAGDPLNPSPQLLVKLGSIIIHADEWISEDRHDFDLHTFQTLLAEPDVVAWLAAMDKQAYLPKKRNNPR